jgi:gas vesicle protein
MILVGGTIGAFAAALLAANPTYQVRMRVEGREGRREGGRGGTADGYERLGDEVIG